MGRWALIGMVAAAGAAGTLARWGLASAVNRMVAEDSAFRWPGTLAVNLAGCFAFGIVWGLSEKHVAVSPAMKVVILTGFMGAFTTFSSLAFDTGELMRAGRLWAAMGNLAANNVLGVGVFFAGAWVVGGLGSKP